MNTKQLKLFLLIADLKSFSKTAELEALTQPAVTQQIIRLEKEMGSSLLKRKHKRIELTKKGRLFYRFAKNMISMVDNLEREMKVIDKSDESYIRIGSSHIPTSDLLYSKIAEFKKENPHAYIIYELSDTENICYMVENGIIDLGFVGAVVDGELSYTSFSGDELKLVAHQGYEISNEITLEELKEIPLIINQKESGVRRFLERKLEEYKILFADLNIISEIGLPEALIEIVKYGVGCAFVPSRLLDKELIGGDLKIIHIKDFSPYRSYYAVTKKGAVLSKLAKKFLDSFITSSQ
jgi:DNA-binding transcriptional LysR family regulator